VSECFKIILERLPNLRPADGKPELIVQPPLGRRRCPHLQVGF
jgi:hypothetical protein